MLMFTSIQMLLISCLGIVSYFFFFLALDSK